MKDYKAKLFHDLRRRAGISRRKFCDETGLSYWRCVDFERGASNSADIAFIYLQYFVGFDVNKIML